MVRTPPARKPVMPTSPPAKQTAATVDARLGELQTQFEQLKAQVRQAQQLSSLGTAAAMIAHEVNNLLTPILGYAKAALKHEDTALKDKALTTTVKNVEMLIAMSTRVLGIAAAKPGEREEVQLRPVIDDAIESLCRNPAKDGVRLTIEVPNELSVCADRLQIQQLLFNLLLNAREAMAPSHNGRLRITAARDAERVIVTVHNSGDPIPADLLPHIFEPFQSSKGATRDGKPRCGGLGLALCRDLVEENDGTIDVTSDAESGTTFRIDLPSGDNA